MILWTTSWAASWTLKVYSVVNCMSTFVGMEDGVVGSHKVVGFSRVNTFQGNVASTEPQCTQNITKVAKSLVNIVSQSLEWWFPAGWLSVQANQCHLKDTRALVNVWQASETSRSKADQLDFGSGVLVVYYQFIDEAMDWWWKLCFATVCVCGGFWQIQSHLMFVVEFW